MLAIRHGAKTLFLRQGLGQGTKRSMRCCAEPGLPRCIAARGFFFGGSGDDDEKKNRDAAAAAAAAEGEADTQADDGSGSASFPLEGSDGGDNGLLMATVGTGDDAPRPSPLLVLPVERRPLFPGMVQGLILTNVPTMAAIEAMHEKGGNHFVGVFLRRPGASGDHDEGFFPEARPSCCVGILQAMDDN